MAAVTNRRAGILRIIVREYVETAAPVGSRTIHDKYGVSASPATIRHEMQALEEEGLLEQPHTLRPAACPRTGATACSWSR